MIESLVRPEIRSFIPYNANQIPFRVKLDANESPFDLPEAVRQKLSRYFLEDPELNLYPDTDSIQLRNTVGEHWKVPPEGVVIGTGSDQLIQLLINVFVGKNDKVLCPVPSFSMYSLAATIAGGTPVEFILDKENNYAYDTDRFIEAANRENAKVVFLCTPNNPTGGTVPEEDVVKILEGCRRSIVVVDEAYAEFSGETAIPLVSKYENLVILRTFSKAYGLAGIRCGYSISGKEIADQLNKVRPPYNISALSQKVAELVLKESAEIQKNIETILAEREYLASELSKLEGVHIYPSKANFLLVKVRDGKDLNVKLVEKGILVRFFGSSPLLENCLRISVGTREQNEILVREWKSIL